MRLQLRELEEFKVDKEEEIEGLKVHSSESESYSVVHSPRHDPVVDYTHSGTGVPGALHSPSVGGMHSSPRVKAHTSTPFDGETGIVASEDWLPTLQQAAVWNEWLDNYS